MQIDKLSLNIDRNLPKQRRSTKPRRRSKKSAKREQFNKLFPLAVALITISSIVWLPWRNRERTEPPAISTPANNKTSSTHQIVFRAPLASEEKEFVYNVKNSPNLLESQDLQDIVDELVAMAKNKGLPTDSLSISLIDVSNPAVHTTAGYQNKALRFPASVAKMFWMAAFFGAVEKKMIPDETKYYSHLDQMMRISNNDAASRILDALTDTKSGGALSGEALQSWLTKRRSINTFYQNAGFEGFKMSTKNYPIYYLKQKNGPLGRDVQLKEGPPSSLRNQVTTDQAARLVYEIYTRQAISPTASRKMAYLMTRDLDPKVWKDDPLNCVKGFLGESLPTQVYFGSKIGYTTKSRQEAAFVRTLDDKAVYVLVVFGEDIAYAKDEEIFPAMSKHVFDRLTARGPSQEGTGAVGE